MKHVIRALAFAALIFSSCLSSDGDLEKLPDSALTSVTFTDKASGAKNTGVITYEGPHDAPSKITVTWSGDLRLLRIPIVDTRFITKTIYEFVDGKITRITNVNDEGVNARVEDFTYNSDGYLTKQLVTEINVGGGGPGFLTYENYFYYDPDYDRSNEYYRVGSAVKRVIQTRCNMTTCFDGVFDRIDDYQFKSYIPATITKTGDPLDYTFTNNSNDVSTFSSGSCQIYRSTGQQGDFAFEVPLRADYYNGLGHPSGFADDEGAGLYFNQENVEQLADLYYVLGQWINPVYNKTDAIYDYGYGGYGMGLTYGRDNTAWILPRLRMATTYSNYVQFGFALEATERRLDVDFESTVLN